METKPYNNNFLLSLFVGIKVLSKASDKTTSWPHEVNGGPLSASWLHAMFALVFIFVPFPWIHTFEHVLWERVMLVAYLGLHGIYNLFLFLPVALND